MIELSSIKLKFKRSVIDNGRIIIHKNKITVLSGKSGSGKTSILMEMCMLSDNADKYFLINNKNVKDFTLTEKYNFIRNGIAIVSQKPCLLESMTVIQNIELVCSMNQKKVESEKIEKLFGLMNLKIKFNTKVEELSGGEKQRLSIICAIMKDTPIIVMDEPTAYIDRKNINKFICLLKELRDLYQKTIVIATHNKNIINVSDVHYYIDNNHIHCLKENEESDIGDINYDTKKIELPDLNIFLKHYIKVNKKTIKIFLLSLFLIGGTISLLYTKKHSQHISEQLKKLESKQVLLDTHKNITNQMIFNLRNLEGIDNVVSYTYFISDNNYVVSPYISEDYFDDNINYVNKNNTRIYANYAVYREKKDQNINLVVDNQNLTINVNYYLEPLFEDYTIGSDVAKVIYIPLDLYNNIISDRNVNKINTSIALINLQDDTDYGKIIDKICDLDFQYDVLNNDKRKEIENLQDKFNNYILYIVKFIMVLLLGTILVLQVISLYKWRKQLIILEINGVPRRMINRLNIKKEILENYKIYLLTFFLTIIMSMLLKLLDLIIFKNVLLLYVLVFILNLFISYIVMVILEKKYNTCDLIK